MKKIFLIFLFFLIANSVCAFDLSGSLNLIYSIKGDTVITNPENYQFFYDELKGEPKNYLIDSSKKINFYVNLLVPLKINQLGRYSAKIFVVNEGGEEQIAVLDGVELERKEFYNSFDREWYWKGPEFEKQLEPGKYRIEVYSAENKGRYVLLIGKDKRFDTKAFLNSFWQIPWMKMSFSGTSVLQFFLTSSGIVFAVVLGGLIVFLTLINYFIGLIKDTIKHNEAKTLLLTSGGMPQMKDEIIKLLQKPAYDVTVAVITTAAKSQENSEYVKTDWSIMKEELGFNIEEFDIEGKTEHQVKSFLEKNDIIFVEGGNALYLMKAMQKCNFEKIIRNLLKLGKVYIGAGAGTIVAGKTLKTAYWLNRNLAGAEKMKGLGLVKFDIFVHFTQEWTETIIKEMPNVKKRAKELVILTDNQGILVEGKEIDLIGDGEQIIV